jgi:hypothetical protein
MTLNELKTVILDNANGEPRGFKGQPWAKKALSMVSPERLQNLQDCCEAAIDNCIPGDFVETGVWRGGCTILMQAILKERQATDRAVWCCDSFEGLPRPYMREDMDLNLHLFPQLAVSQEEVEENFRRLGLLDVNVRFLKGWFIDTLPTAPIDKIAVLRLDGDLASSTLEALENLESKVSPGGFILVDDFNDIPQCKWAVEKYRKERNITAPIHEVDWTGIYWVKQ